MTSSHQLRISQCRHLSVTLLPSQTIPLYILYYQLPAVLWHLERPAWQWKGVMMDVFTDFARVIDIRLHWNSCYCGLTDKVHNLLTLLNGYQLARIGLDYHWICELVGQHAGQDGARLQYQVNQQVQDRDVLTLILTLTSSQLSLRKQSGWISDSTR